MKPYIIAGPCSAESEEQVLTAATALKETGADAIRAGLWKPRTHPGSFEGVGECGLEWLVKASKTTGLPVCTEVASVSHIEKCLEAGLDMLWIGSRSTTNPMLVQEMADCLKGCSAEIWIKNPVSPDIELWSGAVERLRKAGIDRLGLIHRGFSSISAAPYRNSPIWPIAVRMRTRHPELPLLCDPSHIAGDRAYVRDISQRALDIGFNGLMVEVHPCPDTALSDAKQQLSPEEFASMLGLLVTRDTLTNSDLRLRLEEMRSKIDAVDDRILEALAARMQLSREIGTIKAAGGMSIIQKDRWEAIVERNNTEAEALGLDKAFVEAVFDLIHGASVQEQKL